MLNKLFVLLSIGTIVCVLLVSSAANTINSNEIGQESETDRERLWLDYKLKFNKNYDEDEDLIRKQNFMKSLEFIKMFRNQEEKSGRRSTVGLNDFSDWSETERKNLMGYHTNEADGSSNLHKSGVSIMNAKDLSRFGLEIDEQMIDIDFPEEVDWRLAKPSRVTRVQNQGHCNSCWAFGTTGLLESSMALYNMSIVDLSEQFLIDCSVGKDTCCSGGLPQNAVDTINKYGGIPHESSYPYKESQERCYFKKTNPKLVMNKRFALALFKDLDEQVIQWLLLKYGPIFIGMSATEKFQHFSNKEVFYCHENNLRINHAVLLVGYGTDVFGDKYWLIKNSWGEGWGDKGYGKITRMSAHNCELNREVLIAYLIDDSGQIIKPYQYFKYENSTTNHVNWL